METIVKTMEADIQSGAFGLRDPKVTDFRIHGSRLEIEIYASDDAGIDWFAAEILRNHVSSRYGIDGYSIDVVPIHQ